MSAAMRRAVWLLGFCQCVLWGVLYYGFSVFLVPMEQALGLPRTTVAGAFSAGLLATALLAPTVGRLLDRDQARRVTRAGVALAVAGLFIAAHAGGALGLYLGWLVIGVAMAMLLYEPAFALVIRAIADHDLRLRALAAVTVLGGLASTLFLPAVAALVAWLDWRAALLGCAAAVLAVAWTMERLVLPALPGAASDPAMPRPAPPASRPPHYLGVATIFVVATLATMALTTLLIPLLIARGTAPAVAAQVLGALGIAQVLGRVWLLRGERRISPPRLVVTAIALEALGLIGMVLTASPVPTALAVAVFGLGAGLQTLARPWLVQSLYGVAHAGHWNGRLARWQGFARAAGPVGAAAAAWLSDSSHVLLGMAALLLLTLPLAWRLPNPAAAGAKAEQASAVAARPAG